MGGKYYAVRVGRRPGIYNEWSDVKPLVEGYPGAQHKSFKSRGDAEAYMSSGPTGAVGVKRGRDLYDDDEREEDERYLSHARQSDARPSHEGGGPHGLSRQPNNTASRPAQPQPTIGVMIGQPSAPAAPAPLRGSGGSNQRNSNQYGAARGGSRFDPVVDGPLQHISRDRTYALEFDGAARGNPGQGGCGALLRRQDNGVVVCRLRKYMGGGTTNNEAEYTALLEGLKMARSFGISRIHAMGDSKLVVLQVDGTWQISKPHLRDLYNKVHDEVRHFDEFKIRHIPREHNSDADKLSNDAIDLAYQ